MTQMYRILGVPFGYLLTVLFTLTQNYGISLILITLFAKIITIPSSISQQKGMAKSQRLQPKIRKIQAKYAGNQQKIQQEIQALYQREGQNPMGVGCMPMLASMIPLFGLIGAIYYPLEYPLGLSKEIIDVLTKAVQELPGIKITGFQAQFMVVEHIKELAYLVTDGKLSQFDYDQIANFDFTFLGMSLGQKPNFGALKARDYSAMLLWLVPISSFAASMATSVFTFLRQKQTNPEMAKNPATGCMSFGMPLFSLYIAFQFPVGIGVYWTASGLFSLIQTIVFSRTHSPQKVMARLMVEDTIERRSREENLKLVSELKKNK